MRAFVVFLVGLLVGIVAARLVWTGSPAGSEEQEIGAAIAPRSESGEQAEEERAPAPRGHLVLPQQRDPRSIVMHAPRLVAEKISRTRGSSVREEDDEAPVSGSLSRPSPDLDSRFSGEAMSRALEAAFAETEIEGNVVGTSCSEYPCMLMGALPVEEAMDAELLPTLLDSEAMAAYREDAKNMAAISVPVDQADRTGPARQYFFFSFHPAGDNEKDRALSERFHERFRELAEEMVSADAASAPSR